MFAIALLALVAIAGCGGGNDQVKSTSANAAKGGAASGNGATQGGSTGGSGGTEATEGAGAPKGSDGRGSEASGGTGRPEGSEAPTTESESHGGSLTKAQFVKLAGQICTQGRNGLLPKVAAYAKQHGGGKNLGNDEAVAEALRVVFLPAIQSQIDEIRAIGLPKGDKGEVYAILDSMQEAVDAGKESAGGSSSEISKGFAKSAKLAREYGLASCAYG